jgi:hypothetical protein
MVAWRRVRRGHSRSISETNIATEDEIGAAGSERTCDVFRAGRSDMAHDAPFFCARPVSPAPSNLCRRDGGHAEQARIVMTPVPPIPVTRILKGVSSRAGRQRKIGEQLA